MDEFNFWDDEELKQGATPPELPAPIPSYGDMPNMQDYDKRVTDAMDDAKRQKLYSYLAQAAQQMGTATAQSRGMAAPSTKMFEELRADAGTPVAQAQADKQAAIKAYLDKKRLDFQAEQGAYMRDLRERMLANSQQQNAARLAESQSNKAISQGIQAQGLALREDQNRRDAARDQESKAEKAEQLLVPGVGYALTADDAKKLKEAQETKASFDRKLDELEQLRSEYGVEYMNREAVARGKQLSNSLLLDYKNLAKLGVLSQSDEKIVNAIIPEDPLGQDYALGQDPILSGIKKLKTDVASDYKTTLAARMRAKPPVGGAPVEQAVETKVVGGVEYIKAPGGWKRK